MKKVRGARPNPFDPFDDAGVWDVLSLSIFVPGLGRISETFFNLGNGQAALL
jgi:hypothetical protein